MKEVDLLVSGLLAVPVHSRRGPQKLSIGLKSLYDGDQYQEPRYIADPYMSHLFWAADSVCVSR